MTKSCNPDVIDNGLNEIKNNCTRQVATIGFPATFYEAYYAPEFAISTAYALGDAVRPAVWNGFVYEVTTAGTSAGTAPSWPTSAGTTVVSGSVTFTARASKVCGEVTMASGDFTLANGDTSGRKLTVAAKTADTIEVGGNPDHLVLLDIDSASRRILYTTDETSSIVFSGGGQANWPSWKIEIQNPAA